MQQLPKKLFLDLEETIIKNIHEPDVLFSNIDIIREIIETNRISEVNIFSFAIHSAKDKDKFNKILKKPIEELLSTPIKDVITVEDIKQCIRIKQNIHLDIDEVVLLWGKFKSFQDFCIFHFNKMECILVDDMVPDSTIFFPKTNLKLTTISI